MKKRSSIFAQMLQMIPRYEFEKAVRTYGSERHSKGFSSWSHFVALLFGQLAGQDGLRGVETGMATQEKRLYHIEKTIEQLDPAFERWIFVAAPI